MAASGGACLTPAVGIANTPTVKVTNDADKVNAKEKLLMREKEKYLDRYAMSRTEDDP